MAKVVAGLERCRPAEEGGASWTAPAGGPRHMSKRRGLASLPVDWRARMLAHTPERGPYGLAIVCLWLFGVRPGELVRGVRVQVGADGTILVEVRGGKLRDVPGEAPRGQPLRRLAVRAGAGSAEAVARLRRALARVETPIVMIQVANARRLSDAVRATSGRVFPGHAYTVSPYSFRHAWAADAKAGAAAGGRAGGKAGSRTGGAQKGGARTGDADAASDSLGAGAGNAAATVPAVGKPDADDVSRALGHQVQRVVEAGGVAHGWRRGVS